MTREQQIDLAIKTYLEKKFEYEQYLAAVLTFFDKHRKLNQKPFPIIHSIKTRFKDEERLKDKLNSKWDKGDEINENNIFNKILDLLEFGYCIFIRISFLKYMKL